MFTRLANGKFSCKLIELLLIPVLKTHLWFQISIFLRPLKCLVSILTSLVKNLTSLVSILAKLVSIATSLRSDRKSIYQYQYI